MYGGNDETSLERPLLLEEDEAGESTSGRAGSDEEVWTIRRVVKQEALWLFAGCAVLLVRMPFSISIPYFQAQILAKLAGHAEPREVWKTITYLGVAGSIDAVLDFWCVYLFSYTKSRMMRRLRLLLFEKLVGQEIGYFDVTPSGELASRLTTDIATIANDMTWVFRFSIEAVARIVGVSATLFHTDWRLALVTCSVIPAMAAANRLYSKLLRDNAILVQDSLARANSVAQEVLSCFRVVYSFANEAFEYKRYHTEVVANFKLNVKVKAPCLFRSLDFSITDFITSRFLRSHTVAFAASRDRWHLLHVRLHLSHEHCCEGGDHRIRHTLVFARCVGFRAPKQVRVLPGHAPELVQHGEPWAFQL